MNTSKEDFGVEDILTGLYKLASIGMAKTFDADLTALEESSGESLSLESLTALALIGASNSDEIEFVRVCRSALVVDKDHQQEDIVND